MTMPEVLLWRELRKRPDGLKFRHQHAAGPYSPDFYCYEASLAIEVDGESHERGDQPEHDAERDEWLRLHKVRVLRIPAGEVLKDLDAVIRHIVNIARG